MAAAYRSLERETGAIRHTSALSGARSSRAYDEAILVIDQQQAYSGAFFGARSVSRFRFLLGIESAEKPVPSWRTRGLRSRIES